MILLGFGDIKVILQRGIVYLILKQTKIKQYEKSTTFSRYMLCSFCC